MNYFAVQQRLHNIVDQLYFSKNINKYVDLGYSLVTKTTNKIER